MTTVPQPGLLQSYVDPQFGTTIRRITAVPTSWGAGAFEVPMYSTTQAWNANETYMILYTGGQSDEHGAWMLLDGHTYKFIRSLPLISPSDIEQLLWDPQDPDVLYYPSNFDKVPNFYRYHVSTNKSEVVANFQSFCPLDGSLRIGRDVSYMSWGPGTKLVGLECKWVQDSQGDSVGQIKFTYDIVQNKVLGGVVPKNEVSDAMRPGPSGKLGLYLNYVVDSTFKVVRQLTTLTDFEHSCMGSSKTTHDIYNSVIFDGSNGKVGTLVTWDLTTAASKIIVGPATGYPYPPTTTHISALATQQPGLVAASMVGNTAGQGVLDNELILANIDTGMVCRVGHNHSFGDDGHWGYWAEPHVTLSPSGTRLLFGSDWGNGPSVDTYVVEMPNYKP